MQVCQKNSRSLINYIICLSIILQKIKKNNIYVYIKIEIFIAILTSVLGFILEISIIEWGIIVLNFGLVLGLEMVNTAIERTVDLVTKDYYELAKNAKDVAAGAVLIASMFSFVIGIIIFLPKIIELIK